MLSRRTEETRILNSIKSGLTLIGTVIPTPSQIPKNKRDRVLYISSPITTGLRMYQYINKNSLNSIKQIDKDVLLAKIMNPNIRDSIVKSSMIRNKGYKLLIVPGHFVAEGWTQDHYLDLWTKVIRDYSHVVYFNSGWEYSNGCVKELLISLECRKDIITENFTPLNIIEATKKIYRAIDVIESMGIIPTTLYSLVRKIELLQTKPLQFI